MSRWGWVVLGLVVAAPGAAAPTPTTGAAPVAVADRTPIAVDEVDATLQLALYDLELARYELRAARLRAVLVERLFGAAARGAGLSIPAYVALHATAAGQTETEYVDAQFAARATVQLLPPAPPRLPVRAGDGPLRGPAEAPVTIVEFADYECPHSRSAQPVLRNLLVDYPGRVRLVFRDFPRPLHRNAPLAHRAARCAGGLGNYWPYHDLLFQNADALGREALLEYGRRLGLDMAAFAACLDGRAAAAAVERDVAEGAGLGVRATPTLFVNGIYVRGPVDEAALRRLVDAELSRLGTTPVPPPPTPSRATPEPTPRQVHQARGKTPSNQ